MVRRGLSELFAVGPWRSFFEILPSCHPAFLQFRSCHPAFLQCHDQKVTPARNPNVRGAPASPTNPDGARPGYGSATGMYRVSNALRTHTSPNARLPRSPARRFVSVYASWPTVFASSYL